MATKEEKELEAAKKIVAKAQKTGLEARVISHYFLDNVIAFSGMEYVKSEWRLVPPGMENQALVHPYLELRDASTEKEIDISSKTFLANAQTTAGSTLQKMTEPEVDPNASAMNREVEPVGDPRVPEVREAKIEKVEEDESTSKKSSKKK